MMIKYLSYNREPVDRLVNVMVGFSLGVMVTLAIVDFM